MRKLSALFVGVAAAVSTAAVLGSALPALADETGFQPFGQEFTDAATKTSGNAFGAQTVLGQLTSIFGIAFPWPGNLNAFPETLIADDGRSLNELYREAMLKQVASDPVIRTPDLINPYNTSVLSQPYANPNGPVPTPFR